MKFRQLSLTGMLGEKPERPPPDASGMPEVYDFFAGAGGFSEGARAAGCRIAWVCDNDPLSLKTHAANHPSAEHHLADLPLPRSAWPFPTDGRPFHAHFSPPCQKFSNCNQTHRKEGDRRLAKSLVEWSIETALTCGAQTWSLEQVPNAAVIEVVEAAKKRHPGRVSYARVDFSHLGVPQTRTRLIAGSPTLVAQLLRRIDRANITTVRSAVAKPRGTHVRNGKAWVREKRTLDGRRVRTKAGWGDNCHTIDEPAPTVLAHRELSWVTRRTSGHHDHCHLRPKEIAALQTFPLTYRWPDSLKRCLKEIGNAVPPLVARSLMQGLVQGPLSG
jgi:DNA (cytosine-5)-methyltransferase 1